MVKFNHKPLVDACFMQKLPKRLIYAQALPQSSSTLAFIGMSP
ncbi:MAG: hypothetical protein ACI9S8_001942, partial [Chlamydiales bacterium]